ncbi:MAG: terminase small subunit [Eubacteriales bacterium]|jgi:phage terminase small subunit|nr:terminase small subunit [Eubacteriales bacterium]
MAQKLNMRQRRFAEIYAEKGNIVQSAIAAGYSENYANARAHELLENVGVAELVRELADKIKDDRILNAKDRQVILSDIARDNESESADRIRAIDTLNKMTGEYLNKFELNGSLKTETSKLDVLIKQMNGGD